MRGKAEETRELDTAAFGRRLSAACDDHCQVPGQHRGRLRWLVEQLAEKGVKISVETARRWLSGEARPRSAKMGALAEIVQADVSWLALGVEPEPRGESRETLPRNPLVGIAAGLADLEGGVCALPYPADQASGIDLHIIIDGRKLDLCLARGSVSGNVVTFSPRTNVPSTTHVLGGLLVDEGDVSFFDLSDFVRSREREEGAALEALTFQLIDGQLCRDGQRLRRLRRFGVLTLV